MRIKLKKCEPLTVLSAGEFGAAWVNDKPVVKIGDGVTPFESLQGVSGGIEKKAINGNNQGASFIYGAGEFDKQIVKIIIPKSGWVKFINQSVDLASAPMPSVWSGLNSAIPYAVEYKNRIEIPVQTSGRVNRNEARQPVHIQANHNNAALALASVWIEL